MIVHKLRVGDTVTPIGCILTQGNKPVDLASVTVKVVGYEDDGDAWITEGTTGVTVHPTNTFTVDTTNNLIKCNGHKATVGDQIVVSTTTTLPSGLAASTRYYVCQVFDNAFRVTDDVGAEIDITSSGSGTHSFYIVGSVTYDFQAADVDTAGIFRLFFRPFSSSERDTYPASEHIRVEIGAVP